MSEARGLLRAILAEQIDTDAEALFHLETALLLEVDPLDYCASRFGIPDATVMERAASWAGLAYLPSTPNTIPGSAHIARLDDLGEVRTIRAPSPEGTAVFAAPLFAQFIALKAHARENENFRRNFYVVPKASIRAELARSAEAQLLEESKARLWRRWRKASARVDLPLGARLLFVGGLLLVLAFAAIAPMVHRPIFVPLVGLVLVVPAALRLWAALWPASTAAPPPLLEDSDLPLYTILVPLRDEADMVPQLCDALRKLDYPPEKLDIKFVVEKLSASTVAAVQLQLNDPRFELVAVPHAEPLTKPKALNYAVPLVRGAFLVVYDAEDVPDPGQLRLAASRFAERMELDCLQAELVVENARETVLATLFAGEYAGQFGLMLPLLARLKLPMPLGGTSNHFRVQSLREVGGWDAYNVTEDADLGVRMSRLRYRTATIASRTGEEAPIRISQWIRQRTRWMKGWMQTFIVHNRHPRSFLEDIGWRGFLGFQIYVGSMILSAPLHCVFMFSTVASWLIPHPERPTDAWDMLGMGILIVGYGGPAALVVCGLVRLGRSDLLPAQCLLPLYWLLHSVAAGLALVELITRPYFWAKTKHGASVRRRPPADPPRQAE